MRFLPLMRMQRPPLARVAPGNLFAYMTHHRLTTIDLAEQVELDVNRTERALEGDFNSDALSPIIVRRLMQSRQNSRLPSTKR